MFRDVCKRLGQYAFIFLMFSALLNAGFVGWLGKDRPKPTPSRMRLASFQLGQICKMPDKMVWYRHHARECDLIFLGDSRTYCAFDPEGIDPLLGTRSINLAQWAHWFPTQYPHFKALLPLVPPDTVVVWSIGRCNFHSSGPFNSNYLIGLEDAWRYLAWGHSWKALEPNLATTMANGWNKVTWWWPACHDRPAALAKMAKQFPGLSPPRPDSNRRLAHQEEFDAIRLRFASSPHVSGVSPLIDGDSITSAAIFKSRGNYLRIEIDHDYFRAKQCAWPESIRDKPQPAAGTSTAAAPVQAEPAFWRNFIAIVDLFEKYKIRLVVNEVEEAPWVYAHSQGNQADRAFMQTVADYVRQRGFTYVRVDWDQFHDADYFDYNHLNSDGVARFTPLIAEQLRPHVGTRPGPVAAR